LHGARARLKKYFILIITKTINNESIKTSTADDQIIYHHVSCGTIALLDIRMLTGKQISTAE